jgi:hypothetical protein
MALNGHRSGDVRCPLSGGKADLVLPSTDVTRSGHRPRRVEFGLRLGLLSMFWRQHEIRVTEAVPRGIMAR